MLSKQIRLSLITLAAGMFMLVQAHAVADYLERTRKLKVGVVDIAEPARSL